MNSAGETEETRAAPSGETKGLDKVVIPAYAEILIRSAEITDNVSINRIVYYRIRVETLNDSWVVQKRFSQFRYLSNSLKNDYDDLPKLETSKSNRLTKLNDFLQKILQHSSSTSQEFVNFLYSNRITSSEVVEVQTVTVKSFRVVDDSYVMYQIVTNHGIVERRYSEFLRLDGLLRPLFSREEETLNVMLTPTKLPKWLMNHFDTAFMEQRRVEMEDYLRRLVAYYPSLIQSTVFQEFIRDYDAAA